MGPIVSHSGLHTCIKTISGDLVQSPQCETHISMVYTGQELPIEIFSAQCLQEGTDSVLKNAVGICFLSSTFSTIDDARSDALYLSKLFFGSDVRGIYNTDKFLSQCRAVTDDSSVQALLFAWESYFIDNPDGRLVQCFYGDGCFAIQKALELSSYRGRVAVVGINSYAPINHDMHYLYRSVGHFFSGWTGSVTMPFSPNSHGAIYQSLQDPIFVPCLLHAFYEMAKVSPKITHYYPEILGEVAIVLERPGCLRQEVEKALFAGEEVISRECQWLMHGVTRALQEREPWSEHRLCRIVNIGFTCLRIVDYVQLIILNNRPTIESRHARAIPDMITRAGSISYSDFNTSVLETTTEAFELNSLPLSTQIAHSNFTTTNFGLEAYAATNFMLALGSAVLSESTSLFSRNNFIDYSLQFFTGYWGIQALSELVLLKTDTSQHYRTIRAIALAFTSSLTIGTVLEIAYNMPLFLSQRHTERLFSVIRGGLLCYDMMWLLKESVYFGIPPVRRRLQKVGKRLQLKEDLTKIGIGTSNQCVRIDSTYRKQIRSANVFVKAVELMLACILGLGTTSVVYTVSHDKDNIPLIAKSILVTLIMLVTLYALRKQ